RHEDTKNFTQNPPSPQIGPALRFSSWPRRHEGTKSTRKFLVSSCLRGDCCRADLLGVFVPSWRLLQSGSSGVFVPSWRWLQSQSFWCLRAFVAILSP